MGGTLKWAIDDAFKAMVAQAVKNGGDVLLVKDQGVYLMSHGPKVKKGAKPNNLVCYAQGFDPEKVDFDTWYDKAHRICGGDDFGEGLPAADFAKWVAKGYVELQVKLTATSMAFELSK